MGSGANYEYHTALGIECDLLNDNLEKKLNSKKDAMKAKIERNIDSQSVTSAKTNTDLRIINSSGV